MSKTILSMLVVCMSIPQIAWGQSNERDVRLEITPPLTIMMSRWVNAPRPPAVQVVQPATRMWSVFLDWRATGGLSGLGNWQSHALNATIRMSLRNGFTAQVSVGGGVVATDSILAQRVGLSVNGEAAIGYRATLSPVTSLVLLGAVRGGIAVPNVADSLAMLTWGVGVQAGLPIRIRERMIVEPNIDVHWERSGLLGTGALLAAAGMKWGFEF